MIIEELFSNTRNKEKLEAIEFLVGHSSPRAHFFFMIILSVSMATLGILLNSIPVIIASMLIAPMLYPILSLSMGFVMGDLHLLSRSFYTILRSFVFTIIISLLMSIILKPTSFNPEQIINQFTRDEYLILSAVVAIIAGAAGAYSLLKIEVNENLAGTAIAVSLIPPLATIGVAASILNWSIMRGAFLLFIINIVGIVFSSSIIFSLSHLARKHTVLVAAINKDDKELKKEHDLNNK